MNKNCSNSNCKELNPQPTTQFDRCKASADGYQYRCKECRKTHNKKNAKTISEYKSQYYIQNRTEIRKQQSEYYSSHLEQMAFHRIKNKQNIKLINSKYKKNNPGKVNARNRKRQASKIMRTPSWLTHTQLNEIQSIYVKAAQLSQETKTPHHVDHIVPLQGKNVSGLHVPWNLQILVGPGPNGNLAKGNRF